MGYGPAVEDRNLPLDYNSGRHLGRPDGLRNRLDRHVAGARPVLFGKHVARGPLYKISNLVGEASTGGAPPRHHVAARYADGC